MPRANRLLTTTLAAALLCAPACSSDDTKAADAGTSGPRGDASTRDTGLDADPEADARPDAQASIDAPTDTAADTSTDTEPAERPLLPDFAYYRQDLGCGGSTCIDGVAVNIIGGIVEKTENGHARHEDLQDHEIRFLQDFVLTDDTYQKMLDGWSCGPDTDLDGVKWSFDARVLVDGTYERTVQNISGCMAQDADHDDTTEVRDLIDMLDEVRDDHFE
ncbi:MAG: hypothetical protein ACOC9J_03100 [Persicimonas sp.]